MTIIIIFVVLKIFCLFTFSNHAESLRNILKNLIWVLTLALGTAALK